MESLYSAHEVTTSPPAGIEAMRHDLPICAECGCSPRVEPWTELPGGKRICPTCEKNVAVAFGEGPA